jgi:hypothetical protein
MVSENDMGNGEYDRQYLSLSLSLEYFVVCGLCVHVVCLWLWWLLHTREREGVLSDDGQLLIIKTIIIACSSIVIFIFRSEPRLGGKLWES